MKTPVWWPPPSKREAWAEVMAISARRDGDMLGIVTGL
jgi:myo-inositol catabolism protein IolC